MINFPTKDLSKRRILLYQSFQVANDPSYGMRHANAEENVYLAP